MDIFSHFIPITSISLRLLGFLLMLFYCIPLQVREVRVKNGLRTLRWQMLLTGFIILFINGTSIWLLLDVIHSNAPQPPVNSFLQIINGVAFLVIGIIGTVIYHTQYSEENKKRHEQIDKMERSEAHLH